MARDLTRPNANRVAGPLFPLPRGTDAPSAPLPDKVAADRDLVTKALAEIERLPPAQQAVMVMTVTAALAENAGAVLRLSARERQLLVRARRTLRARFGVTTRLRNSVPA
ncbi:MAG: hypothetical protein ABIO72_02425 [Patescibacteria group bacterium]